MPSWPRAPNSPSGCRCSPMRRAVLVGRLAHENEIWSQVRCCAVRRCSTKTALLEIARMKGQGHLLAMSERPTLSPDLTDVIVRPRRPRGRQAHGRQCRRASSPRAAIRNLIKRASQDGVLTLTVGQRDDLSDRRSLKQLLAGSIDVIRRRLFDVVKPERQNAIKLAMARDHRRARALREQARFRAGAAHDPGAASRPAISTRRRCSASPSPISYEEVGRRAVGDVRREDRNPRQPDHRRSLRSDPDRRQDHRPRMGDRARADPAAARAEPGAVADRHRERAGEFRRADALDRRARGRLLEERAQIRVASRTPALLPNRRSAAPLCVAAHEGATAAPTGRNRDAGGQRHSIARRAGSATTDSP